MLAIAVRGLVFLLPLVGAFLAVYAIGDYLFKPHGLIGVLIWFIQASIVGSLVSAVLDRFARRLLPLATLFNMSLVFPDQAPSRFGLALRAGSFRQLQERVKTASQEGLGETEVEAASRAIEFIATLSAHDRMTRGHTERVRAYADLIAEEMGLSAEERSKLTWGVLLHDIGKLTVPPEVLNKETPLTDEEWDLLQGHPEAGGRMIKPLAGWLGSWSLAAAEHHERWDGEGYPFGLAGQNISLAGRITAVADAYDVITSKRSYKAPISAEAARRELVDCAGAQFDPDVVRALLNISLKRRWMVGPLAVLSHLPFGQLGTARAVVSVGTVLSVGAVVAVTPSTTTVDTLAFTTATTTVTMPEIEQVPPPTTAETGPPTTDAAPEQAPPAEEPTPDTSSTTATVGSTAEPSSTVSTATVATTAAPTTPVPTTAVPTTSVSTTAAQTTTTGATTATTAATTTTIPTTTTTALTTTTTVATTTTTAPPAALYYLKNPSSGDSFSQLFKTLSLAGPDDTYQPNFDTNRDSVAGLSLEPTGNGFAETDLRRIQRYGIDTSNQTISGPAQVTVYVATENDLGGAPVTVRANLVDCETNYTTCGTVLGDTTAATATWVGNGFQQLTFDFGTVGHSFGSNRRLLLRLITEGSEEVHIAFDSTPYPSAVAMTLN